VFRKKQNGVVGVFLNRPHELKTAFFATKIAYHNGWFNFKPAYRQAPTMA